MLRSTHSACTQHAPDNTNLMAWNQVLVSPKIQMEKHDHLSIPPKTSINYCNQCYKLVLFACGSGYLYPSCSAKLCHKPNERPTVGMWTTTHLGYGWWGDQQRCSWYIRFTSSFLTIRYWHLLTISTNHISQGKLGNRNETTRSCSWATGEMLHHGKTDIPPRVACGWAAEPFVVGEFWTILGIGTWNPCENPCAPTGFFQHPCSRYTGVGIETIWHNKNQNHLQTGCYSLICHGCVMLCSHQRDPWFQATSSTDVSASYCLKCWTWYGD